MFEAMQTLADFPSFSEASQALGPFTARSGGDPGLSRGPVTFTVNAARMPMP